MKNSKIKELDLILISINKLSENGNLITVEDINDDTGLNKNVINRALSFLKSLSYCEKKHNGYEITFNGQYFIEKSTFPFSKRPFYFEKFYSKLKFIAILLNALLITLLGVIGIFKEKPDKILKQKTITNEKTKINTITKKDTILINTQK